MQFAHKKNLGDNFFEACNVEREVVSFIKDGYIIIPKLLIKVKGDQLRVVNRK